jgi:sugar lactone lactonase YvrE
MDPPEVDSELLDQLVQASRLFDGSASDAERNCWMALHQHVHGVLPSEYDIREVPEPLYLAVLARRREQDAGVR